MVTARDAERVEHNAHLIFPGTQSDNLLFLLDQEGVSVSAGSACQAGVLGVHVDWVFCLLSLQ